MLVSSGLWRFQGLTQWQFLTIGVYFGLTSALTLLGMRVPPEAREQQGWHTAASNPNPNPNPNPSPSPSPSPSPGPSPSPNPTVTALTLPRSPPCAATCD